MWWIITSACPPVSIGSGICSGCSAHHGREVRYTTKYSTETSLFMSFVEVARSVIKRELSFVHPAHALAHIT